MMDSIDENSTDEFTCLMKDFPLARATLQCLFLNLNCGGRKLNFYSFCWNRLGTESER